MENVPAELVDYLCNRLGITACLIVGGSGFYSQVCRLVPHNIRPHFIHYKVPANSKSEPSADAATTFERDPLAILEERLQDCLQFENKLRTLLIIDADIYLAAHIPVEHGTSLRGAFERLPYCLSIGCSAGTDYRRALHMVNPDPGKTILQGHTIISSPEEGSTSAWIELLGSHLTPNTDQYKPLCVAAIIIAHNESDILEDCLNHLHAQGITTHLIDDESDDATEEIAMSLLNRGILKSYQRSGLTEDCEERWSKLLILSRAKAQTLDVDWIIHHDADELRESPWEGVNLAKAISIVDGLGFNCIDHTVIEFLFSQESDALAGDSSSLSAVKRLTRFRFPSHSPNFTQLKAWRKADWQDSADGGHRVILRNQAIFPLKFLINHYPLRSLAHAKCKVFVERLSRFSVERKMLGWHDHYDSFQYFQEIEPWTRRELHIYNSRTFYAEFLLERLTGCGLDRTEDAELNTLTGRKVMDAQEQFRVHVAQALGIDLMSAEVVSHKNPSETLWTTQTNLLQQTIHTLLASRSQALEENNQLRAELATLTFAYERKKIRAMLEKTRSLLGKIRARRRP